MLNGIRDKLSRLPKRQRALRVVLGMILFVLFLEVAFYFGFNFFFLNWTRTKINEATGGVYEVAFDQVNFSILRRGFFLKGVALRPDPNETPLDDQVLFDFRLEELSIRDLWYDWGKEVLSIGQVTLDRPDVALRFSPQSVDPDTEIEQRISAIRRLELEIQKSLKNSPFEGIWIKDVLMSEADLFLQNFLSENTLQVSKAKLHAFDLDWQKETAWNTPFNAKGFEFNLGDVKLKLSDQVHTLQASTVLLSSVQQQVTIREFSLLPDLSVEAPVYYSLALEELQVGNVDLNEAFQKSRLEIEELILENPKLKIQRDVTFPKNASKTGDLNELVAGILESIHIRELAVNSGGFLSSSLRDSLDNRVEVGSFDFKMVDFYLGDDQQQRADQFFYGQEAAMDLKDVTLYLSDKHHVLKGKRVKASSFLDRMTVEEFQMIPREVREGNLEHFQKITIQLTALEFEEADLKKLYNEEILDVSRISLRGPTVELIEREENPEAEKIKDSEVNFLKGFLKEARIGTFELIDGKVLFKNSVGERSNNIGFEKFSLNLEKVEVSLDSVLSLRDILLAEEMVLSLDDYRLKLRDNLHVFKAAKVVVDSKRDLIDLQGFSLQPENSTSIQDVLTTYGKSIALDFRIPSFQVRGIDIRAALLEKSLLVREIFLPKPNFSYKRYRKRGPLEDSQSPSSMADFEGLIASYFDIVSIDSIRFEEGKLDFSDYSGRKEISFSEEDLSLRLKDFYFKVGEELDSMRTFFSEEIVLDLADYSFSLAQGDYDVKTNHLQFNTKSQTLVVDTLRLVPGFGLNSKLALSLTLPKVALEGLNLEDFIFENKLILDRMTVNGSSISLDIFAEFQEGSRQDTTAKARGGQRIEQVLIGEILSTNSEFSLRYAFDDRTEQSLSTQFDLGIRNFGLDDQSNFRENASRLFGNMEISLNDFQFALPDSVHQVVFSNINFSSDEDETVFSGLQIAPVDNPKPSEFYVEGVIGQVGIRSNDLLEIQQTGVLELKNLRISDADLQVFIQENPPSNFPERKPVKKPGGGGLIRSVLLDAIEFDNGTVELADQEGEAMRGLSFQQLNGRVQELNWELTQFRDIVYLDDLLDRSPVLSFGEYEFFTADSMESVRIGKVMVESDQVLLESVRFAPAMGSYAYLKQKKFQTDAVDLRFGKLQVEGVDFRRFFDKKELRASRVIGEDFQLEVFRDKRIPENSGIYKAMPQDLFQHMPFLMVVDSIRVGPGRIRYREFSPQALLPGAVEFTEVSAALSPVNLSKNPSEHPKDRMYVLAHAKLMGAGEVSLQGQLFFQPPYPMDLTIQLGEMPMDLLNDMLSKGAFLKIREEARVKKGDWSFRMDEQEAIGTMRFEYENLKIDYLDTMSLQKGRGKLGFATFLSNTLIKNNNPRKLFGYTVQSDIYVKRNTSKFIFNTWWKATFSGLKGAVGLGQPQIPKRKEEEDQ